ncbi:translocation/assembly module TamB domain-containing protein [Winogradskyella rapida]|uniref:Translocation/assembly module TamB domain-containing protein n=1 Tax=Winogradskyella rapida TaxID=549701 RepID=A0ABW3KSF6_9FLAO
MTNTEDINPQIPTKRKFRWLRRTLRILLGFFVFLFLLLLFIRSPWGQGLIVEKAVDYVSSKTQTKVNLEKLFITFDGDVQLDGLYLEDKKGDTLVYSHSVEANIPLWKMIRGEAVGVESLDWEGLRANIYRKDSLTGYNFQFLIDAFATTDSTATKTDTTTATTKLVLGQLNFKSIDLVFDDAVAGITSRFKIGNLKAQMTTTNLEAMVFEASDIALSDSDIKFIQKPIVEDTTSSTTPLPKLAIESLRLNNVVAYYESQPDRLIADVNIKEFSSQSPDLNLADSDFSLEEITLKNSDIKITTEANFEGLAPQTTSKNTSVTTENSAFEWPRIKLNLGTIDFENNTFTYNVGEARPSRDVFNPDAIALSNFSLKAQDLILKNQQAALQLQTLRFNEASGLNLKQLAFNLELTDQNLDLDQLDFQLNNNRILGDTHLQYLSLSSLMAQPEQTQVDVNLPNIRLSLAEIFKFQPQLENNPYIKTLSEQPIEGLIIASGNLAALSLNQVQFNWGSNTKITASGDLKNITDPETLQFNIPEFSAESSKKDISQFVNEADLGLQFPETLSLTGQAQGQLQELTAKAKLNTTQGLATLNGHFRNSEGIAYEAQVNIDSYKLNELLNNPQLGPLSLELNSKGSGTNLNDLDAQIEAKVSKFQFNNYAISNLNLQGELVNGQGNVAANYKDDNLNAELDVFTVLDSIASEATLKLNLIGADLQALGLMQRNVKTAMMVNAQFKGNTEFYDATADVKDGVIVYDNKTYLLGDLDAKAHVDKDSTAVSVFNKMLDINLKSNANPQTFSTAIQRHVSSYFYTQNRTTDSISDFVNLKLEGKISQSPLLNEVFLVNVKDLDTIQLYVDFTEKEKRLKANITAPHINYSGNTLDSLAFSMDTDTTNFNFNLGFKNITAGPLDIPETIITGRQTDQKLTLNFLGYHNNKKLMNVNSKLVSRNDSLRFSIRPDTLLLNGKNWTIPQDNEAVFTTNNLAFTNFKITHDNQSITLTDQLAKIAKSHIALTFENFNINEVFNYLNPESKIATGQLNGDFILENPFTNTGILADINIEQFKMLKTDLGTFSLNGNALNTNNYAFNAGLKGGDIDFDLVGDYTVTNNSANLDLNLDINEFKMEALNTLSMGEIKEADGRFSGQFKVTGTTTDPQYDGFINFNDATFNIAKLNSQFSMANEKLNVDNAGLSMTDFTIRDKNDNALVISGTIGTESFINPTFNLDVKANDFQVLNATRRDNDAFYGTVTFDADAKLTGDLQIPKLSAQVTLGADTDLKYVMPASVANIEERDGVVAFVNRENPDAILTQTETQTATLKGFDLNTQIKVDKEAAVTVILDEETGDNFKVSGEGDFIFTMVPNGRMSLSGAYEIADGHYELNLYNLVDRTFLIAPGSRVTWSGDPLDAKLDVRAIYNLETSASGLMASQISGADSSVQNKYRQVLPFNVYLNIDGELMQPQISFGLDMPEEDQGAISGQVYSRVQQVNQQEGELNRQVFSLLVLNRFYPESGSDGSSGGFATIARDNLNDAVSEQLNAFSDKIIGGTGVELDFGLDSYTDYQGETATDRTQLDIAAQKKLFNDRLIVRVGSAVDLQGSSTTDEETPIIGNVSLEYILSEDGRYRLKGFRKSEFENVIDGQTIISGIALIFTQEFNQFSELWEAIFKSQKNIATEPETPSKKEDANAKNNTTEN